MEDSIYNKISWFSLAVVMIFAPLARGAVSLWAIVPVQIVIFSLVFLWLWKVINREDSITFKFDKFNLLIWLFLGLAIISAFFSIYKYESLIAILMFLTMGGVFYLVKNTFSGKMAIRFIILIIGVGTILSLFGLGQYFLGLNHSWWIPNEFIAATYVNHNHFSGYLELVIPLIIGLLLSYESWKVSKDYGKIFKSLLVIALGVVVLAFVFSQSRGAWICLTVSLIFMGFILVKTKVIPRKHFFAFLFFIILGAVYIYAGEDALTTRFRTFKDINNENFIDGRKRIWEGTINMIKDNPVVGTGVGTFLWGFPKYQPQGLNVSVHFAHNEYLHMMAEMGIIALPLLLLIIGMVVNKGVNRFIYSIHKKKGLLSFRKGIILGGSIGILSLALHGLVDFNFHIPANMLVISTLAGIIMQKPK